MPNIKIGSKTFTDVENINLPLADGTGQASFGTGGIPEHIEWHQCPEAVRKFVSEVTYDTNDYGTSHIADYAPIYATTSNYKPIGKTVGDKTFYNEVPGVETPYQADGKYGAVKPLDQVRYINTPSAPNVRDLGGWACDGGIVKYGLLYRGGYLSKTDRDVLVGECGIRHDLDLRGTTEANITKSPLGDDVRYTCAKVCNWYNLVNVDAWATNLRCVFDAATHNEPLYFHCAAGADRTGTLACVLEGLLGVSQSDIDKDYELTSFYSGTKDDSAARRRNESEWTGLINAVNAYAGDNFRDKCISFVAQLGFTADEINTYRKAMIDGEPDEIVLNTSEFTVASNLSAGVNTDNAQATAKQYQPYNATITCEDGYVIDSVTVKCGGKDITASVWRGTATNLNRRVKTTLENCAINNDRKKVIDGQGYATKVTALAGYTLDGAEIKITMGGVDVTQQYYKDGIIAIPNVTGDIEIAVTAVQEVASDNLVDLYGVAADNRISLTSGENEAEKGYCTVGATNDSDGVIPYKVGDIFYIKGAEWTDEQNSMISVVSYTDLDGTHTSGAGGYLYKNHKIEALTVDDSGIATINPKNLCNGLVEGGIRFSLKCSNPTGLVIQKNKKFRGGVTNKFTVQSLNKRLSGTSDVVGYNGVFICAPIQVDLTAPCPVTLVGFKDKMDKYWDNSGLVYGQSKIRLCDAEKIGLATWYLTKTGYSTYQKLEITEDGENYIFDVRDLLEKEGSIGGTTLIASDVQYVQFCFQIGLHELEMSETEGFEILV